MQTLHFSDCNVTAWMGLGNTTLNRVLMSKTFLCSSSPPTPPLSFLFSSVKSFSAYNFWNVKHMVGCSVAQVPLQQPLLTLYQSQICLWSAVHCPSPVCCTGDASSAACSSGQGLLWHVLDIHPCATLVVRVFNHHLNTGFGPTGAPSASSVSGYNLVSISRFRSERHI